MENAYGNPFSRTENERLGEISDIFDDQIQRATNAAINGKIATQMPAAINTLRDTTNIRKHKVLGT